MSGPRPQRTRTRRRTAAAWAIAVVVAAVAASTGRAADPVPVNVTPPTIAANPAPQAGQTLTEVNGTWTPAATGYAYQWYRCDDAVSMTCPAISGATAQTYLLTQADVGHTLTVAETATGAASPSPQSPRSGVVTQIPAPTASAPPTISGTPLAGQTLTEAHGAWTNAPTGYSYQWADCDGAGDACAAIPGATGQTQVVGAGEIGHTLRVFETATNAGGSSSAAGSGPTGIVPAPPVSTSQPKLSGSALVGGTLSCTTGTWTGTEPIAYTYAWLGDGTLIAGATGPTHKLAITDEAQAVKCEVTAANVAGRAAEESDAVLVLSPPACYRLTGAGLKRCRAKTAYQAARARCATLSTRTTAGRKREQACVAKAKLTYKRAIAEAKCATLKGAGKRAACVARARKIKK